MSITREELVRMLDESIAEKARQWGADSFYTRWELERKEKVLQVFDSGSDPVPVCEVGFSSDGGWDIIETLYTDGSIRKEYCRM